MIDSVSNNSQFFVLVSLCSECKGWLFAADWWCMFFDYYTWKMIQFEIKKEILHQKSSELTYNFIDRLGK